jgi:hypothetical protein
MNKMPPNPNRVQHPTIFIFPYIHLITLSVTRAGLERDLSANYWVIPYENTLNSRSNPEVGTAMSRSWNGSVQIGVGRKMAEIVFLYY